MPGIPAHVVWPGIVIGLLGMSVTLVTVTVVAAVSDPSFVVESDYHDKAMRWDDHVAQQASNAELGWVVSIDLATMPGSEEPALLVRLVDRRGVPIAGATLAGECFHHAAANDVRGLVFSPRGESGGYVAPVRFNRGGIWDLQLRVDAEGHHFTHGQKLELGKVGG